MLDICFQAQGTSKGLIVPWRSAGSSSRPSCCGARPRSLIWPYLARSRPRATSPAGPRLELVCLAARADLTVRGSGDPGGAVWNSRAQRRKFSNPRPAGDHGLPRSLSYDVSGWPGVPSSMDQIKAPEALGSYWHLRQNYFPQRPHRDPTWECDPQLSRWYGLFHHPHPEIKCGGAPRRWKYLAE